jgi:D-xylonolactonase
MPEWLQPNIEIVADYGCETGENPLWHPLEERLYWTDIPTGRLFRYDPKSGQHEQIYQGRPVGGFTFHAQGGLLLFRDRGNATLWREGETLEIIDEIPAERNSRFNDVIADPVGRVFCGTMSSEHSKGRLYRLDLDGTLTQVLDSVGCSNGMGFTPDLKVFYYTDSFAREIFRFDYCVESGEITNRRNFLTFSEPNGLPDGLTVDANGRVWSALWDGSGIVRISPEGQIETKWKLPTAKVSSLAFGGDNLQDLYVTTAGGQDRSKNGAFAGVLFRMPDAGCGIREFFSNISAARKARS